MLYVQLDANWPDNPKLIEAGLDGAGLHAVTMCVAKRLATDGWVDRRLLYRHGASDDLIDRLVTLELFDADAGRVRPHDWLERNPSQAVIEARRAAKIEGARRGNHRKWEHPGEYEDCPTCQAKAQVIAPCEEPASHSDRLPSPYTETKPERSDATPPATTAAERQSLIAAACRAEAEERATAQGGKSDKWIAAAAAGLATDHHQALHTHLVANPSTTLDELVEVVIECRTGHKKKPEPVNPSSLIKPVEWVPSLTEAERAASRAARLAMENPFRRARGAHA